jgi:hypothetical protein
MLTGYRLLPFPFVGFSIVCPELLTAFETQVRISEAPDQEAWLESKNITQEVRLRGYGAVLLLKKMGAWANSNVRRSFRLDLEWTPIQSLQSESISEYCQCLGHRQERDDQ